MAGFDMEVREAETYQLSLLKFYRNGAVPASPRTIPVPQISDKIFACNIYLLLFVNNRK